MTIRADADELIAFLDGLAKLDPEAIGRLVAARVPCGLSLADHPTVQVAPAVEGEPATGYRVGLLGILNGYAGAFAAGRFVGSGPIAAVVEDDGRVTGFRRLDAEAGRGQA